MNLTHRVGVGAVLIQPQESDPLVYLLRHKGDGRWRLPRRNLNLGESPTESVAREVRATLGIDPTFSAVRVVEIYHPLMLYSYAVLTPEQQMQIHNACPDLYLHFCAFSVNDMDGRPMWDDDRLALENLAKLWPSLRPA